MKIIGTVFVAIAALTVLFLLYRYLLKGRFCRNKSKRSGLVPRVELSFEEAMEDGTLSDEELAVHYAPEVYSAVNTMVSVGGKGDFVTAVNYDGDWACDNNWYGLAKHSLKAVVYWNVHRTATHWFIGYNFYHPRDDAEFAFDRHENDLEGIMLCVPAADEKGFKKPIAMYTEGHGGVPVFFDPPMTVREGSHADGGLLLDGDRPVIYITPNGIYRNCGHNIESANGHTTYAYVGNNGIRYYHGGVSEQPSTYKGYYTKNPCSYELRSTEEFFGRRNGPYGDGCTFGSYGAFRGNVYGTDRANPPWNWQSRNPYGIPGSFLSDPVWVFQTSVVGLEDLSAEYTSNPWADWKIALRSVARKDVTLALFKDGKKVSRTPGVFSVREDGQLYFFGNDRRVYMAAGPKETVWDIKAFDGDGNAVDCQIDWEAAYLR